MADTPTPVSASEHETRALEMMVRIRDMARTFEGFTFAGKGRRVQIAAFATLPDEAFELMALACDSNPDLAAAGQITSAELREVITSSRVYGSVVVEMKTQAKGMDDTLAEQRATVGRKLLNAYHIGKRLNHQDPSQTLVPHLNALAAVINRSRAKKAKPGEDVLLAAKKATPAAGSTAAGNASTAAPAVKA